MEDKKTRILSDEELKQVSGGLFVEEFPKGSNEQICNEKCLKDGFFGGDYKKENGDCVCITK